MKLTKDEFDQWKNGYTGTIIFKFLEKRRKEITDGVTKPMLTGNIISNEAQLIHHGRMMMLEELVNLDFETIEEANERVHKELPDKANLGTSGSQAAGY